MPSVRSHEQSQQWLRAWFTVCTAAILSVGNFAAGPAAAASAPEAKRPASVQADSALTPSAGQAAAPATPAPLPAGISQPQSSAYRTPHVQFARPLGAKVLVGSGGALTLLGAIWLGQVRAQVINWHTTLATAERDNGIVDGAHGSYAAAKVSLEHQQRAASALVVSGVAVAGVGMAWYWASVPRARVAVAPLADGAVVVVGASW